MALEPDPLFESLRELIAVADETSGCANERNYAKTRALQERLRRVNVAARGYHVALRQTRPTKTYRWIEGLGRTVAACLTEMDSVQSAANREILAGLNDARAGAASFASALEERRRSEDTTPAARPSSAGGVIECTDCLETRTIPAFTDFEKVLRPLGWTATADGQRCDRCSRMAEPRSARPPAR